MDFASSFVDSDNLPEAIGSGNLGTSRTRKTCESSAHWERHGWSGPDINPYTIELVFRFALKRVACCSTNVVSAMSWVQYTCFLVICERSEQAKWFEASVVRLIR